MLAFLLTAGFAAAHAQAPVAELSSTDASVKGAVTLTAGGMRVMNGSNIAAGQSTAVLRLVRGGEVRVCPQASVSLSASPNGNQLMLAMNSGTIETHYRLASAKDTILTPDFRILLIGPGEFHVAVAADPGGNTCVRALEHNTAAIVVEEQMGDGVRQLGPKEQAMFHHGSVKDVTASADCGCPAAAPELLAEPRPIPLLEEADELPKAGPDVHVQIDAPFVFRADQAELPPPPQTARLRLSSVPQLLQDVPVQAPAPARKGVLRRVGSWLGKVFR
jgi:hypothetical protein